MDGAGSELANEKILSDFCAGEEDDAAGFTVNAMHGKQFCGIGIGCSP
ncbi:MAG UNVERIFIED_CONTAM: hypothetical protein LVR18_44825 [Planctomycetaceae bacterium]